MKLKIDKNSYAKMLLHAEETFPFECCGFFYGHENANGEREIIEARPVANSKKGDQRRRFEISAFDYLTAEQYADANALTLLGLYHSHPNHPAKPSIHDLKQAVPYFSYVIISVMEGKSEEVTSWQLDDNNAFQQESIETLQSEEEKVNKNL